MSRSTRLLSLILTFVLLAAVPALARNVDLSTVPRREGVQLTIYNSEDLTLVRDTRTITFRKGSNPLQFSWANTLIDPTSVELRFVDEPDKLVLLDTTFPHDKPQMLYWNVQSDFDGPARVEITYFTSGISWSADYVCIANPDENVASLEGFVRVHNHSGEDYEEAQVRLVVGTINLVEKIAQLAQIPMADLDELRDNRQDEYRSMRRKAANVMMQRAEFAAAAPASEAVGRMRAKEIVKEGLSEYFIYTIEGAETIPHGWSKRMRSFEADKVPVAIEYRYRPQQYGDQLVRMYVLTNEEASGLGSTPLPDGAVRVFRANGRDGLSFLAQQSIKYVPIGDKIEVNLGTDPQVIFELIQLRASRDNLWLQVHGADILRRVDDGAIRIAPNSSVVGWDERALFTQRIRNYSGKAIMVEVRRTFPGHVVFNSALQPKLHDFQTVEFKTPIPAGEKRDLLFEVVQKCGRNQKQNNVTLEAMELELP